MIITEIQYFFSKIIRFQAIFKDTVEFTCALEFKISSQLCYKKSSLHRMHFLIKQEKTPIHFVHITLYKQTGAFFPTSDPKTIALFLLLLSVIYMRKSLLPTKRNDKVSNTITACPCSLRSHPQVPQAVLPAPAPSPILW
mgnify:CR=1 FL=1